MEKILDILDSIPIEELSNTKIEWHESTKKSCLSYWFPKLQGLPVPKTYVIRTDITPKEQFEYCDGIRTPVMEGKLNKIYDEIAHYSESLGYPTFLRSGQSSFKHYWASTCYLYDKRQIPGNVYNIMEMSCMAGFTGLPADVWVVRDFLDLKHAFRAFHGIPVAVEFRFFIDKGKITHRQFYWPEHSIENPSHTNWKHLLKDSSVLTPKQEDTLVGLVLDVADRFIDDIPFSVDLCLPYDDEWCVTDMAPAKYSFKY